MQGFGILPLQRHGIADDLVQAGARYDLERRCPIGRARQSKRFGFDRTGLFAAEQRVAVLGFAAACQLDRNMVAQRASQVEQLLRLAILELELDFAQRRRTAGRVDLPHIDTQLDLAAVLADRIDRAAQPRLENRLQVAAQLLVEQRLQPVPRAASKSGSRPPMACSHSLRSNSPTLWPPCCLMVCT